MRSLVRERREGGEGGVSSQVVESDDDVLEGGGRAWDGEGSEGDEPTRHDPCTPHPHTDGWTVFKLTYLLRGPSKKLRLRLSARSCVAHRSAHSLFETDTRPRLSDRENLSSSPVLYSTNVLGDSPKRLRFGKLPNYVLRMG